jgi:hypothetical protein
MYNSLFERKDFLFNLETYLFPFNRPLRPKDEIHVSQADFAKIKMFSAYCFKFWNPIYTPWYYRLQNINEYKMQYPQLVYLFLARQPPGGRAFLFTRFLDRTQRRTTVGRTPLDEWSARRRQLVY